MEAIRKYLCYKLYTIARVWDLNIFKVPIHIKLII